jgi:glycosyltransferase involved in cell wall biosynthesis
MKRLISLIIPVYNAEKTLDRCINSIQNQTFSDWEAILIDDGSQDRSGEICDWYADKDLRIHVFHQTNTGVSGARNRGLSVANGDYLMFIDSDDAIQESYLMNYITTINRMDVDVVIGGYTLVENEISTQYYPERIGIFLNEIWEQICTNPQIFGYACSKIFKTDIIRHHHLTFREDMYAQEDFDFCLSYFDKCSKYGLIHNADYFYYYVAGKRTPPVWNFIENQLKLYNIAQKKKQLSLEVHRAITERICLMIYVFFYDAERNNEFWNATKQLDNINGLKSYLKNISVHDEKSFICYQYLKERYKIINRYFKCRRVIRDIVRKFS